MTGEWDFVAIVRVPAPRAARRRRDERDRRACRASCARRRWSPSPPTRATTSNRCSRSASEPGSAGSTDGGGAGQAGVRADARPAALAALARARARRRSARVIAAGIGLLALTARRRPDARAGPLLARRARCRSRFTYRGLYREAPEPGGYVRVATHYPDGSIKYSYAVNPLQLPPYSGDVSGALPVYATGYATRLARALPGAAPARRGQDAGQQGARLPGALQRERSTAANCTAATCCCCPRSPGRGAASRSRCSRPRARPRKSTNRAKWPRTACCCGR